MRKMNELGRKIAEMPVHVDVRTLRMARSGMISGVISILLNGEYFPEKEWNDFPVIVLYMWLDAAARVWQGTLSDAEFRFMDGPFWFEVTPRGKSWFIRCQDDHGSSGPSEGPRAEIDAKFMTESIITCANRVLDVCKIKSWNNRDINDLQMGVTTARATLASASR